MSLARAILRRTIIEALRPHALASAATPSFPTLSGKHVYDSLLDPVDDLSKVDRRVFTVVYTENDDRSRVALDGPIYYRSEVEIVIELSALTFKEREDAPGSYEAYYPVTDAELETSLDILESQIDALLHQGASGALFRRMVKLPFVTWESHRTASTEENARIAFRTIRGRIEMQDFCYEAAPVQTPEGLNRLPPRLAAIAAALPSPVSAGLVASMAANAYVAPVATPLRKIVFDTTPLNPSGNDAGASHVVGSADNLDQQ